MLDPPPEHIERLPPTGGEMDIGGAYSKAEWPSDNELVPMARL
jgi:hypothetical protein